MKHHSIKPTSLGLGQEIGLSHYWCPTGENWGFGKLGRSCAAWTPSSRFESGAQTISHVFFLHGFVWFSKGFSHGFPTKGFPDCKGFPMKLPCLPLGFPMVFPWNTGFSRLICQRAPGWFVSGQNMQLDSWTSMQSDCLWWRTDAAAAGVNIVLSKNGHRNIKCLRTLMVSIGSTMNKPIS